jgi:hypothetical protein
MLETYKAILRGDRLEWSGDAPEREDAEQGIEVYVMILQSGSTVASNGKAMADALAKVAATTSFSGSSSRRSHCESIVSIIGVEVKK